MRCMQRADNCRIRKADLCRTNNGCKRSGLFKNYRRKEKSIFHNRQSCSYIIAPTETPRTKGKHPFCSNALLCLFELRAMTVRSLPSSLLTWAWAARAREAFNIKSRAAVTMSPLWGETANGQYDISEALQTAVCKNSTRIEFWANTALLHRDNAQISTRHKSWSSGNSWAKI